MEALRVAGGTKAEHAAAAKQARAEGKHAAAQEEGQACAPGLEAQVRAHPRYTASSASGSPRALR